MIPFLDFSPMHRGIKHEMLNAFERVYESNWFVLGEEVKQFEKSYADFSNTSFCIGLSNGLDALHLALKAIGVQAGDEVIVPSNTYIATVLAVSYVGATPVFVEPDSKTYNINPKKIEQAITPKTKVIMPVHLYGQACEMEAIMEIAKRHSLKVVEDNAQSQGATFKGQITGSWGDINGTSFYPGKNLGALGDAGAITTNDTQMAEKVRTFRNYGSQVKYYNDVIGNNMRLDEMQAAFLSVKLRKLVEWTQQRQQIANWYNEGFKEFSSVEVPFVHREASHVYHLYVIRTANRDGLQRHLNAKGIGTLIHYPVPPHLQKAYAHLNFKAGDFPIAEELANTSLSLPLWPGMQKTQVEEVVAAVKSFF